tara:strand:- start:54720 stop:55139 length:420 start_codon:yes stop_codon:yes gene_type:complete
MLFLDISGHKAPKRRCKDAVMWFMAKYMPRHKIDIEVHHRGLLREGVYGWCSVTDNDHRPRCFLIEIHNRLDIEQYLRVLFHELVHVHQHVKGDLRDKGSLRLWKGVDYSESDYQDQPWEIEAHRTEKVLFEHYFTSKL